MIDLSTGAVLRVSAPPLAPADRPIVLEHLARMTLGERSLEHDVLQLFDRQAAMLTARMKVGTAPMVAALAHTLKGSARGIGAWNVANSAEAVETAASVPNQEQFERALDRLAMAVAEAKTVIADLLRAH
jgi:HPt (histidine-containing phosphotransfer) domain-containing protein